MLFGNTSFMALELNDVPVLTTEMSMMFPKFLSQCKVFFVFKFSHFYSGSYCGSLINFSLLLIFLQ